MESNKDKLVVAINDIAKTIYQSFRKNHSEEFMAKFGNDLSKQEQYFQYQVHIGATDNNGLSELGVTEDLKFVVNCGVRLWWHKDPVHQFCFKEMSDTEGQEDFMWGYAITNIRVDENKNVNFKEDKV